MALTKEQKLENRSLIREIEKLCKQFHTDEENRNASLFFLATNPISGLEDHKEGEPDTEALNTIESNDGGLFESFIEVMKDDKRLFSIIKEAVSFVENDSKETENGNVTILDKAVESTDNFEVGKENKDDCMLVVGSANESFQVGIRGSIPRLAFVLTSLMGREEFAEKAIRVAVETFDEAKKHFGDDYINKIRKSVSQGTVEDIR
jgi:hypothetical protein